MKKKIILALAVLTFIGGIISLIYRPKSQSTAPFTQKVVSTITITPAVTSAVAAPTDNPASSNPAIVASPTPTAAPVSAGSQQITTPDMTLPRKDVTMTASEWEMGPASITGKVRQIIHIEIKSTNAAYGFAIKDLNVNSALEPGKTRILEIVADRAGTFPFECTSACEGNEGPLGASLVIE